MSGEAREIRANERASLRGPPRAHIACRLERIVMWNWLSRCRHVNLGSEKYARRVA